LRSLGVWKSSIDEQTIGGLAEMFILAYGAQTISNGFIFGRCLSNASQGRLLY